MAIIYSYPVASTVNNTDTLVISVSDTTADNGFLTKSLTADTLASYVTARVNLNFLGDTGTGVINLDTQNLSVTGTANEIETAASSQTLQIGLPDSVEIAQNLEVGNNLTVNNDLQVNNDASVSADLDVSGETQTNTLVVTSTSEMQGSLSMTLNNINNVANPVSQQDAATKSYVDSIVSGGLAFRGSFRADTGEILSGMNTGSYLYNCPGGAGTRVSVLTGDYYVVANAGGQFYCSGDLLNIGDSIIAVADAAADSSVVTDWTTLESDNIEGTGIANTIPIWTDSQVLGDSNISQSPTGDVTVNSSLAVVNDLELSANLQVGGGTISMGNGSIEQLVDPTNPQDAATKAYVDAGNVGQVTGTGTTQTLSLWSDGPNGVLGDSIIYENFASIGIGTNTPSQRLHVDGNVTAGKYFGLGSTNFYLDPNDSTISAVLNGSVGINITPAPVPTQKLHVGGNVTADKYYGNGSTDFYLDPNDSTISAVLNGNVGINITPAPVPTQKLHVGGNVTADKYYGNGSTDFYLDPNNGTTSAILNGDVAIGTTSPQAKLHVAGDVTADKYYGNGSTVYYIDPNNGTTSAILNGNVGIGTTTPASKLEVDDGDIEIDNSARGLILRSPNGTRYRITVDDAGNLSTSTV